MVTEPTRVFRAEDWFHQAMEPTGQSQVAHRNCRTSGRVHDSHALHAVGQLHRHPGTGAAFCNLGEGGCSDVNPFRKPRNAGILAPCPLEMF